MDPGGCREVEAGAGHAGDVASRRDEQAQGHERVEHRLDAAQERQVEQEERDVPPKDRVRHGDATRCERHAMDPQQDGLPARSQGTTDDEGDED